MSVLPNTNSSAAEEDSTKVVSKQVLLLQGSETKLLAGDELMFKEISDCVKNFGIHERSILFCQFCRRYTICLDLPFTFWTLSNSRSSEHISRVLSAKKSRLLNHLANCMEQLQLLCT